MAERVELEPGHLFASAEARGSRARPPMRTPLVELLHVSDCPSVNRLRATVAECLTEAGIDAVIHEREGAFASPTLLIDGVDVVTGSPAQTTASCRLDLPNRGQILAALKTGAA
jgi:hypothetical protein